MGNELEKQYGLKGEPLKLPGAYNFLKHADHPNDQSSSLIIIKSPHKAGIMASDIILPIKDIKNLSSDYSVATTARCKPIGLVKPRSQTELKIIMSEIIKLGAEIGRIFLCEGKLMLWCEQVHNTWNKSPEEVEIGKMNQKSKIYLAGLSLLNYMNYIYQKQPTSKKKKDTSKNQMRNFFNPKDKKQYLDFVNAIQYKLAQTTFWNSVSDGMKNLLVSMLTKDYQDRIDSQQLKQLSYFSDDKQLKLYTILADEVPKYEDKQIIIFMETLQIVVKNRIIFDDLILEEYLTPLLVANLKKMPEMILSCTLQLPNPPLKQIYNCLKKANPQNHRLLTVALNKKQKLHQILDSDDYDAVISRTAFCCFQSQFMVFKLLNAIPYCLETIKEANYKKQIQFQLINTILDTELTEPKLLLMALKCTILIVKKNLISNITKLQNLKFNPKRFEDNLQLNLHILELYRLMILEMEPVQSLGIMMPKLALYLSNLQLSNEVFLMAKKCTDLILKRIQQLREIVSQDEPSVQYQEQFFYPPEINQPSQQEKIQVLDKEAQKNKNQNIVWLSCILTKQKFLLE